MAKDKRRIEPTNAIEVFVNKRGNVVIYEEIPNDDDQVVDIPRDRLPQFISWLQEIQDEITAGLWDGEEG